MKKTEVLALILSILVVLIMGGLLYRYLRYIGYINDYYQLADLNQNGILERYDLKDGRLRAAGEYDLDWSTDPDWRVTSFRCGDVTNDGREELLAVVWKSGSFGRYKPFWLDQDRDFQRGNHLFVYALDRNVVYPVWMSSVIDRPIRDLTIKDVEGDGLNELIVNELTFG